MAAHIKSCLPTQPAAGARAGSQVVLLLRAQQGGNPAFWLDLAVRQSAQLQDVDHTLRSTWLECCGHMSEFYDTTRRTVGMSTKVAAALGSVARRLGYVYDFGSSTELIVTLTGTVEASLKAAVQLVARNEARTWPCDVCEEPATVVCAQCVNEDSGFFCEAHAPSHDCGEEMLLPVVNSPRMGVCGYTGDA